MNKQFLTRWADNRSVLDLLLLKSEDFPVGDLVKIAEGDGGTLKGGQEEAFSLEG